MDCLFCKIASKEIASAVIYEDDTALAFLDLHPLAPGHALVIPKIHAENILDLPDEEVGNFFKSVKKVTALIKEKLDPTGFTPLQTAGKNNLSDVKEGIGKDKNKFVMGFTIGINHGRIGGQAIDHLHVHVIPRFEGDGGGSLHSVVKNPPKESLEDIRKKIAG